MRSKSYSLEMGQPKNLVVQQHRGKTDVFLNNEQIGSITTQHDLKEGRNLYPPDGSIMTIRLARNTVNADRYQITRNNIPVPGSSDDPNQRWILATKLIFLSAIIYTGFNIIYTVATTPGNKSSEFRPIYFIFAGIMAILGILVIQKIAIALYLAVALQGLEVAIYFLGVIISFISIFTSTDTSKTLAIALIINLMLFGPARIILFLGITQAISAVKGLKFNQILTKSPTKY